MGGASADPKLSVLTPSVGRMMALTQTRPTTGFVDGYEVRPGLRVPWDGRHERLSFSFFAVCDDAAPQQWHGEVVFAGQVLHRTSSYDTHLEAGRAAEKAFVQTVTRLFSS
jgi:hypothetical protein